MNWKVGVVVLVVLVGTGGGMALAGPTFLTSGAGSDTDAVHKHGAQSMEGPLEITTATAPALSIPNTPAAQNAVNLACGAYLNFCPTDGGASVYRGAGNTIYTNGSLRTDNFIYVGTSISNPTAVSGGSVGFNDAIRNLSTTTALFESSTVATGGSDYAFTFNSLNNLGTDYNTLWQNNGATIGWIRSDAVIQMGEFRAQSLVTSPTYAPPGVQPGLTRGWDSTAAGSAGTAETVRGGNGYVAVNPTAATSGGQMNVNGGTGGAADASLVAAAGGQTNILGGAGGAGSAARAAGAGADLLLYGGAAGANNGGGGANGGSTYIRGGAATGAGTNGVIYFGTANTSSITVGAAGITINVPGDISSTGAATFNSGGGTTSLNVGGGYLRIANCAAAPPPAGDCDDASEDGRMCMRQATGQGYICTFTATAGWSTF